MIDAMYNEMAEQLEMFVHKLPQHQQEFAHSLIEQQLAGKKALSPKQLEWLGILHQKALQPKAEPKKVDLGISVAGIIALFDKAGSKLKFPRITIAPVDDVVLRMSRAGSGSQYPGSVVVKQQNDWGDWQYLGRVTLEGQYMPHGNPKTTQPAFLLDFLRAFSEDPQKLAAEYGKKSGYCCFCNSELTDKRSLHVGYGPVCAKHYGLHYPTKAELDALFPETEEEDA